MKVFELIAKLKDFSDDMEVCISDEGMGEGGTPNFSLVEELASSANLDGDESCGYLYDYPDEDKVQECLDRGMTKVEDGLYSFKVLMLTAQ